MVALISVAERRARFDARHPVWQRQTLDSAFLNAAAEFANRPFVITDAVSWTYADVAAQSEAIAKGLRASGIGPGDRVALLMANYPEFLPAAYAVWRLGATLIPVNFAFRAQELAYVLEQSQCRALITMAEFRGLDYLAMLDELSPGWEKDPGQRFTNLAAIVVFGASRPGVPTLADVARRGAADPTPLAANTVSPDEPAVIMYTSGTTGQPKGVLQSHDNLLRNSFATARHRAYEDGRRILFALPLYHAFALVVGVLTVPWAGGAVVPQLVFDPLQTIQAIERHKVSDALFVPTMAIAVVEHPAVTGARPVLAVCLPLRGRGDAAVGVAADGRGASADGAGHRLRDDRDVGRAWRSPSRAGRWSCSRRRSAGSSTGARPACRNWAAGSPSTRPATRSRAKSCLMAPRAS